ncbi:DUF2924 domain-containing protein [uncultured Enterovirga sp.]|uniref:DUF2924 domain-containing protein n=1 Tax=uncultured Enterovirga sp. TaxID=2026352 RepID=UPI0035CC0285
MTARHFGGGRPPADPRLTADLERLAALDLAGLRRRWRRLVGSPAPAQLPRSLLHRILAYRVQAAALGDLDRDTARELRRMAEEGREAEVMPLPELRPVKPGTLLVREWEGTLQRVMVLAEGYAWNGATYPSLTGVARAITGSSWNGPRFFGLRTRKAGSQDRRTGL